MDDEKYTQDQSAVVIGKPRAKINSHFSKGGYRGFYEILPQNTPSCGRGNSLTRKILCGFLISYVPSEVTHE